MESKIPYKIESLSEEEQNSKLLLGPKDFFIRVEGYLLPKIFLRYADANVRTMPLRSSDIFVASFARSGTTWTQELVWLLKNDLDFDKAKEKPLTKRFPLLEYFMVEDFLTQGSWKDEETSEKLDTLTPAAQVLAKVPQGETRFIKTHLPLCLLPEGALDSTKVVYVARDPRDVAVSCFHLYKDLKMIDPNTDFKTYYYEKFSKDLELWSPYFEHVKEAWTKRHHPNLLFIFYEDLSKDLKGTAKRVSRFLGKEYSEGQYERLCDHLQFSNFTKNNSLDPFKYMESLRDNDVNFFRKGVSGGWRDHFDEEMTAHVQRWMEHNLRDSDLVFPQV